MESEWGLRAYLLEFTQRQNLHFITKFRFSHRPEVLTFLCIFINKNVNKKNENEYLNLKIQRKL